MKQAELTIETQGKHYEVDVMNIKPLNRSGGNIRVDYGDIDELAASILENGIIVPIRAYRDKDNEGEWIAIDGHRRLTAAKKLVDDRGITIRAKVIVCDSRRISDEQLIYDMITTNSGKPLSPIEMSEAVRRLISYGHKPKEIALKFGKSAPFVRNLEMLASCPKRIRDLVQKNKISYTLVLDILKDSPDFNVAIETIERSLSIAKSTLSKKENVDSLEEDDEVEEFAGKVTQKHVDRVNNKVDSLKELQRIFRNQIDHPREVVAANQGIYEFAKKLIENRLLYSQMEKLFFNE